MARWLFALLFLIYIMLYSAKHTGINLGVVSFYAADLLCLPITLSAIRYVMYKAGVIRDEFELTPGMIFAAALSFGIVFEWYLPQHSDGHHSDMLDFVAYLLGGIAYFIFRKNYREKQIA